MSKKEMVVGALLGLLTISSISLHMDNRGDKKRMHGVVQRMGRSNTEARWAGMERGMKRPDRGSFGKGTREKTEKKK